MVKPLETKPHGEPPWNFHPEILLSTQTGSCIASRFIWPCIITLSIWSCNVLYWICRAKNRDIPVGVVLDQGTTKPGKWWMRINTTYFLLPKLSEFPFFVRWNPPFGRPVFIVPLLKTVLYEPASLDTLPTRIDADWWVLYVRTGGCQLHSL